VVSLLNPPRFRCLVSILLPRPIYRPYQGLVLIKMPRLPLSLPKTRPLPVTTTRQTRLLSTTRCSRAADSADQQPEPATKSEKPSTRAHDTGPGWGGREGRDHAVKRPPLDVEAETAQQGMQDHAQRKEGSDAISRKDERNNQQKAKEEFPEAPVVIGMNDERGGKDH
jgi:hypothetical protein